MINIKEDELNKEEKHFLREAINSYWADMQKHNKDSDLTLFEVIALFKKLRL